MRQSIGNHLKRIEQMCKFSFIIPIYNRPDELRELLASFVSQEQVEGVDYEVIVVEDGSTNDSEDVVSVSGLPVKYIVQENTCLLYTSSVCVRNEFRRATE